MTQRFTASPDPVARGGSLTIGFTNPGLAGQTTTITVVDNENGTTDTIDVTVGADGSVSTTWTVPSSWGAFVVLEHPTSDDLTVAVTSAPAPAGSKKKTKKATAKRHQR